MQLRTYADRARANLHVFAFVTETFWRYLSDLSGQADQMSLNKALKNLNISWKETTKVSQVCSTDGWEGEADGGLRVFVFPQRLFCRRKCCHRNRPEHYVTHPGGNHGNIEDKRRVLQQFNAWFVPTESSS